MQVTGRSNQTGAPILAANTREMRAIARDAHLRKLNRRMTPAQFKLLDPKGTHIISPQFTHYHAEGEEVERHVRTHVHIKLIGKQPASETIMDISMEFLRPHLSEEDLAALEEFSTAVGANKHLDDYEKIKRVEGLIDA